MRTCQIQGKPGYHFSLTVVVRSETLFGAESIRSLQVRRDLRPGRHAAYRGFSFWGIALSQPERFSSAMLPRGVLRLTEVPRARHSDGRNERSLCDGNVSATAPWNAL